MSDTYGAATAHHYAAYRPPLHETILKRALPELQARDRGLDIGCGTGQSSIALRKFCREVVGLEPSRAMLDAALPAEGVRYVHSPALPAPPPGPYDVIAFAGSLFYLDAEQATSIIATVAAPGASVVVYDFEVHLSAVLRRLGISAPESDYDHDQHLAANYDFVFEDGSVFQQTFTCTAENLMHLIGSVPEWRSNWSVTTESARLRVIRENLGDTIPLTATCHWKRYRRSAG